MLLVVEYFTCGIVEGVLHMPVLDIFTWLCCSPCHRSEFFDQNDSFNHDNLEIVEIQRIIMPGNCLVFSLQVRFLRLFTILCCSGLVPQGSFFVSLPSQKEASGKYPPAFQNYRDICLHCQRIGIQEIG